MSKNPERRKEVLDGERAVNETYMQELEARFGKASRPIAVARSAIWTDDIPTNRPGGAAIGPLIGRVALLATDSILGDNFYIGPSREDRGGVEVVSWSAPVAGLFFDGRQAQEAGDFEEKSYCQEEGREQIETGIAVIAKSAEIHSSGRRAQGMKAGQVNAASSPEYSVE